MFDEKKLAAAMKVAWRGAGYLVLLLQNTVMVRCGTWAFCVDRSHAPRKALGLIAEHVGELPETGAFRCGKEIGAQTMIVDEEIGFADRIVEIINAGKLQSCRKTELIMNGDELWQDVRTLRVRLVDPEYSRIIHPDFFCEVVTDPEDPESSLYVQDMWDGWLVVQPKRRGDNAKLEHLDGFPWCGEVG